MTLELFPRVFRSTWYFLFNINKLIWRVIKIRPYFLFMPSRRGREILFSCSAKSGTSTIAAPTILFVIRQTQAMILNCLSFSLNSWRRASSVIRVWNWNSNTNLGIQRERETGKRTDTGCSHEALIFLTTNTQCQKRQQLKYPAYVILHKVLLCVSTTSKPMAGRKVMPSVQRKPRTLHVIPHHCWWKFAANNSMKQNAQGVQRTL